MKGRKLLPHSPKSSPLGSVVHGWKWRKNPSSHGIKGGREGRRGEIVDNFFQISHMINVGGFGQVFGGYDLVSGATVAIKVESARASIRLLRLEANCLHHLNETEKGGELSNSHFMRYLSYGENSEISYLVMEACGQNLREMKKQSPLDRLSVTTSLWVLREMLSALEFLHSAGWLHRDIKPPNFCLPRPGDPRRRLFLIDFGMSRYFLDKDGNHKPRREHCVFHGTVRYASPGCHAGRIMLSDLLARRMFVAGMTSGACTSLTNDLSSFGWDEGRSLLDWETSLPPSPSPSSPVPLRFATTTACRSQSPVPLCSGRVLLLRLKLSPSAYRLILHGDCSVQASAK